MNWLDYVKVEDFKKVLPLIRKEMDNGDIKKVSVKKVNDKKFGTCFKCNILVEQYNDEFIEEFTFGQYGLIDADNNDYDNGTLPHEFIKFMLTNLKGKKINNIDYKSAFILDYKSRKLQRMNKELNELIEDQKNKEQKRIEDIESAYNPLLLKGMALDKNQKEKTNFTDKNWIDLVDLKHFEKYLYKSKLLHFMALEPEEVENITKEVDERFGPCIVIKTHKVSDYYGKYGYVYGESPIVNSFDYDYKFNQFGVVNGNFEKYNPSEFCKFMIIETMGKTKNNKTYTEELKSFIEKQKSIAPYEEYNKKRYEKYKEEYLDDIRDGVEEIEEVFEDVSSEIKNIDNNNEPTL